MVVTITRANIQVTMEMTASEKEQIILILEHGLIGMNGPNPARQLLFKLLETK